MLARYRKSTVQTRKFSLILPGISWFHLSTMWMPAESFPGSRWNLLPLAGFSLHSYPYSHTLKHHRKEKKKRKSNRSYPGHIAISKQIVNLTVMREKSSRAFNIYNIKIKKLTKKQCSISPRPWINCWKVMSLYTHSKTKQTNKQNPEQPTLAMSSCTL